MSANESKAPRMTLAAKEGRGIEEGCKLETENAELRANAERYRAWRQHMIDFDCSRNGEGASDEALYDNMVDGIIERAAKAGDFIAAARKP